MLLVLAFLWSGAVYYASLLPLQYRATSHQQALDRFLHMPWYRLGIDSRQDLVANGLLFVPIGFLWAAAFAPRNRHAGDVLSSVVAACSSIGLALLIEYTQAYFPNRTMSWNDVASEAIGATAGSLIWLSAGRAIVRWVGRLLTARGQELVHRLLATYAVGLLGFSLLPCDVVLTLEEIELKWQLGRIRLWQPTGISTLRTVAHLGLLAVAAVPVGWYLRWKFLEARTASGRPLDGRSDRWLVWLTASVIYAGLSELVQVFVYSRYASLGDAVAVWCGLAIGTGLASRSIVLYLRVFLEKTPATFWLGLASAWSIALLVIYWYPFELESDPRIVQTKWQGLVRPPFAAHYMGTEFNALSNILFRAGTFGVLGGLCGLGVLRTNERSRLLAFQAGVLFFVVWGGLIEVVQIGLAGHVCDITDVLVGAVAGAVAMCGVARGADGLR